MPEPYEELLSIADKMDELAERGRQEDVKQPLQRLKEAAEEIGRAFSGSWIGYHASVYYQDLEPPPPGDHFSQAFGPTGNWNEFRPEDVSIAIHELAGDPDMEPAKKFQNEDARQFGTQRLNAISILEIELTNSNDPFLKRMKGNIESLSAITVEEEIARWRPQTAIAGDAAAWTQGYKIAPPHIYVLAVVNVIQHTCHIVQELAKFTRQAAEHILRRRESQRRQPDATVVRGTKVFIGHGSSQVWRELKEFFENRLNLEVEEFNRVPVAGMSNKERLSEMLRSAGMAFLVMTAEDEQPDGQFHPRMNVVHEAGLFQGRLGFERAIVLLEDGCEEFSNIAGLGQIRFPRNDISAKSEEIRMVLEREGLLRSNS